ncbi:hypothetical protein NA57DRAFT_71056 [Rhizodiscina lignyota]|uniref:Uncharacterized protein n=1 Tax=Rhizodiscina lignyota TaxID=1504668 RepID=A0A9P4IRR5_9PEZI|nr:hypothetical protein NA57DRAFT_71056 [Rhizodiscina lignyota]
MAAIHSYASLSTLSNASNKPNVWGDIITNTVFGILSALLATITIWQAQRMYYGHAAARRQGGMSCSKQTAHDLRGYHLTVLLFPDRADIEHDAVGASPLPTPTIQDAQSQPNSLSGIELQQVMNASGQGSEQNTQDQVARSDIEDYNVPTGSPPSRETASTTGL